MNDNDNEYDHKTNQENNFELVYYALMNDFDTLKSLLIKENTYNLHYNDDSIFCCALHKKNYDFISFLISECNLDSNDKISRMINSHPDIQKMFMIRDLYLSVDKNVELHDDNPFSPTKKNKL